MSSIQAREGHVPTLTLRDDHAASHVEIAPGRGGIVTRFFAGGRDVLFLDPATLADPKANVRGGVPILFPTPGKLAGDRWAHAGRSGTLKQHGYARSAAWQIVPPGIDGAKVLLRLEPGAAPPDGWPFRCSVDITYALDANRLRLDVRVANEGDVTMPFGFGLHPYFAVADADKSRLVIPTAATRAFDNVTKSVVPFSGFDFSRGEVDLHLLDHGASSASLALPGGPRVVLRASPEFSHWVVWSLPNKDFVCLEPWTSPGDAMNTGERLLHVPKGAERALFVELELEA
jgi:galactose mutarotase-like enzyme